MPTNIKERVIELANFKGVALEKFFSDLGVTYGSFKGQNKNSSLNSSVIERIHELYPDINLSWLISGKGEILAEKPVARSTILGDNNYVRQNSPSFQSPSDKLLRHKDELIAELRLHIADLKKELDRKESTIEKLLTLHLSS